MSKIDIYFDSLERFEKTAPSKIPNVFKGLDLSKGRWFYGIASTSDEDIQGEMVFVEPEVAKTLEQDPYNKIYPEHETKQFPIAKIYYSRIVPELNNQHIILAKLFDSNPLADNYWNGIQEGAYDSFSVAGEAETINKFEHGKNIKLRKVKSLREVSMTSMPANPNAGIAGAFIIKRDNSIFFKSASAGGIEIFNEKQKEDKMENFVKLDDFNKLNENVMELAKSFSEFTESYKTDKAKIEAIEKNILDFKKAVEKDIDIEESDEMNKSDIKIIKEDIQKKFEEMSKTIDNLKATRQTAVRSDDRFEKSAHVNVNDLFASGFRLGDNPLVELGRRAK